MIGANIRAYIFNTVLRICCKFSSIYLATNRACDAFRVKDTLKVEVELINIWRSSESLLRLLSGEVDLNQVELDSPMKVQL